jgi:hypothetical protein
MFLQLTKRVGHEIGSTKGFLYVRWNAYLLRLFNVQINIIPYLYLSSVLHFLTKSFNEICRRTKTSRYGPSADMQTLYIILFRCLTIGGGKYPPTSANSRSLI